MAGDVAWIDVLPSMDKFAKALSDGTDSASKTAGKSSGAAWSKAFEGAASTSVTKQQVEQLQTAANKTKKVVVDLEQSIAKTRASEREASAKVLLAEQQLADARAKSGDDSAQAQAAELRLEAARERSRAAAQKTTTTEDQLKAAHREHKEVTAQLSEATDKLGQEGEKQPKTWSKVSGALEKAKGGFESTEGKVGLLAGSLLGVAGGAEAFSEAWNQAMDLRSGVAELTGSLNLTAQQSQEAGAVASSLYADAWGEGLDQVTDDVGSVISSIDGLRDASQSDIEAATQTAIAFGDAFDVDVAESARNAGILIKTGLAKNATDAFDLMTAALQRVPKAMRGEAVDAIQEYSTYFHNLGFTGQQAMGLITAATANGQYGIDKMGDAIKEFSIRSTDMSTTSVAAYKTLGLSAKTMSNDILAGGSRAQGAFQKIVTHLQGIKNPTTQANTAISLFGTQLEDLGTGKVPEFLRSLRPANSTMKDTAGKAAEMTTAIAQGQNPVEKLKRGFAGLASQAITPLIGPISSVVGWMQQTPGVMIAVLAVIATLTVGITALGVSMMIASAAEAALLWPVLAVVAGVAALIAVVVLLVKYWDPIADWFVGIWHAIEDGVTTAWHATVGGLVAGWHWIQDQVFAPIGAAVMAVVHWFRDTLGPPIMAVWDAIKTAAHIWWTVLEVAFLAVATYVAILVKAWRWAWDNVGQPVLDAIVVAAAAMWGFLRDFVFAPIIASWQAVGAAFMWVYDTLISPAISIFKNGLLTAWTWIKTAVFDVIKTQWLIVAGAFQLAWDNLISPAVVAFKNGLHLAWVFIDTNVFGPIKVGIGLVKQGFDTFKTGILIIWAAVKNELKSGWDWVSRNVFDPFKKGVALIGDAFGKAQDAVSSAWDKVKSATAKPVNFVISTVYMKGIKGTWDSIADKVGIDLHLPTISPVKLATGGVLPGYTPGKDVHRFWSPTGGRLDLSGGEAVMRPEWVRMIGGPAVVDAMNRAAEHGGYADGGILGKLADLAHGALKAVIDPVGMVKNMIGGPVRSLLAKVGGGMAGRVAASLPMRVVDGLTSLVKDAWHSLTGLAGGGVLGLPGAGLSGPLLMDSGGTLPPGPSIVVNSTGGPEPLARVDLPGGRPPGPGGVTIENVNVTAVGRPFRLKEITDDLAAAGVH